MLDHDTDPADRRLALLHMRRTALIDALSAVQTVGGFTSHAWIGTVDVPAAVVFTQHDRVVPQRRQHRLALALPSSTVVEIDGDHAVFLEAPGRLAARDGLRRVCGRAGEKAVGA